MPVFEIQMSDGSVYQVDAPDENAAIAAIQQQAAAPEPSPAQAPAAQQPELPPGMVQMPDGYVVDTEAVQAQQERQNPVMSYLHGLAGNVLKGIPFVGSYADEAAGKVAGAIGGNEEMATEMARRSQESFAEKNQKAAIAAQLGGAAMSLAPVAAAGAPAMAEQSIGRLMAGGSGLGAAEGGVYGYGDGETPKERAQAAYEYSLLGGALGAAAPIAGRAASSAVRGVRSARAGRHLGKAAGKRVSGRARDVMQAVLAGDEKIVANDMPLAFGSDALTGLAGAVAAVPGRGSNMMRKSVADAFANRSGKVKDILRNALGDVPDVVQHSRRLREAQSARADEAFGKAYENTGLIPVRDLRNELTQLISNKPPSSPSSRRLRQAIADLKGRKQVPLEFLHEMKRTLQGQAEEAARKGDRVLARDLTKAAQATKAKAANASQEYADALGQFADDAALQNAFKAGREAYKPSLHADELKNAISRMSPAERQQLQLGSRATLETMAMRGSNAPLQAARTLADTPLTSERIKLIHGEKAGGLLSGALKDYQDAARKASQIASNSETARRQQYISIIKEGVGDTATFTEALERGGLGGIAGAVARKTAKWLESQSANEKTMRTNEDLARVLGLTGKQKTQAIKALRKLSRIEKDGAKVQAYSTLAAWLAGNKIGRQ